MRMKFGETGTCRIVEFIFVELAEKLVCFSHGALERQKSSRTA